MKQKFTVQYNGKKYTISDYEICENFWSKMRGLMFRSQDYKKPLLFVFDHSGKYDIHSFFCHEFLGIWMLEEKGKIKIVDEKIVKPFKCSVVPEKKFNLLLEIPIRYFEFADGKERFKY